MPGTHGSEFAAPLTGPREARLRAALGSRPGITVVTTTLALLCVLGLIVSVVGPRRGPDPTSVRTNTVLGTLPIDPRVPPGGIPISLGPTASTAPAVPPR